MLRFTKLGLVWHKAKIGRLSEDYIMLASQVRKVLPVLKNSILIFLALVQTLVDYSSWVVIWTSQDVTKPTNMALSNDAEDAWLVGPLSELLTGHKFELVYS